MRAPRMCPAKKVRIVKCGEISTGSWALTASKVFQRLDGFFIGVKRQGRRVFAESLLVGELRVFFLKMSGIRQHDFGEIHRGRRGQNLAAKAVFHQARDVTDVVQMRVRQQQPMDARRAARAADSSCAAAVPCRPGKARNPPSGARRRLPADTSSRSPCRSRREKLE